MSGRSKKQGPDKSVVPDLDRLKHRLTETVLSDLDPLAREIFSFRYELTITDILRPLALLYGERKDFGEWVSRFLESAARGYAQRSPDLRLLDLQREAEPDWFQQSKMIGYVAYADRFAGSLNQVQARIPYLTELGVTYFHLMPLLKPGPPPNDGGYAVMDYREVNSELGTIADLRKLTQALRREGISLCIDVVCNHTAKEHEWAQKALAGDPIYQDYYLMFPDRVMPDRYEQSLPEVFPDFAPGNFTYNDRIEKWVWTTFHEYQWDLNYANPRVFGEMLEVILYLANQGVEILRMDAVAFMWKRLGTDSQNQPEVHYLLQAFRALSRLAAPGLLLKAEAIVSPDRLIHYLGRGRATNKECELAYHNAFMVLLWSSLAEQQAVLMTHALQQMPENPTGTAWTTYSRCHDDIGWAVRDEDAGGVGLSGALHRAFLSDFFSGRFPGSFARGATFQFNPRTGDRRISGSMAALAGLEAALENEDAGASYLAVRRILLLFNLIFAFGGIPLIYMGDEIGLLNDYGFLDDPAFAEDNRWMHRPFMNWQRAEERYDEKTATGQIYLGVRRLVEARKRTFELHAQAGTYAVWSHNDHVFALLRDSPRGRLLVLANFSQQSQKVSYHRLHEMGFEGPLLECVSLNRLEGLSDITLDPYEVLWLCRESHLEPAALKDLRQ